MMSRSWLSEKARLPMKLMALTLVAPPSSDLEHEVHAVVVELDDLRLDGGRKAPLPAIDVEDALHVGLRAGAREHRARLELHLAPQRILVDLAVALERHLVDDRVLDHGDQHARAFAVDAHVGEQAGGEQRLDRLVDLAWVVGVADVEFQVGAHRLRLDAAIARNPDVPDHVALRKRRRRAIEHRLDDGHHQRRRRDQDNVPAPRLAQPFVRHSSRLPFGSPFPLLPLPVGVRWALTRYPVSSTPVGQLLRTALLVPRRPIASPG